MTIDDGPPQSWWRGWGVPALGVIFALVLYTGLLLILVVDGEHYGTVAEWVGAVGAILVGLLAVAFAALAFTEAKSANLWAERAARAEEKSSYIAEQSLAAEVRFTAGLVHAVQGLTLVRLTLDTDSPMLWVREVKVVTFSAGGHPESEAWLESLIAASRHLTNQLPPGQYVEGPWLFDGEGPAAPDVRDQLYVRLDVFYTVTDHHDGKLFRFPSLELRQ